MQQLLKRRVIYCEQCVSKRGVSFRVPALYGLRKGSMFKHWLCRTHLHNVGKELGLTPASMEVLDYVVPIIYEEGIEE